MTRPIVTVITSSSNSGRQAVYDLLQHDVTVIAAFRSQAKAAAFKPPTVLRGELRTVVGVDANKPETLLPAFQGATVAVVITPHDLQADMTQDAHRSNTMIDAAVAAGVRHVIYVGSWTAEFPDVLKLLSARFIGTERHLQELAESKKITFTNLRSGYFHQNFGLSLSKSVKERGTVRWPELVIPSVDPRDLGSVAAVIARAPQEHENVTYNLSGPQSLTAADLARIIGAATSTELSVTSVDIPTLVEPLPPFLQELYVALGDREGMIPLSNDVEKLTGVPPRSFASWVAENKHFFQ